MNNETPRKVWGSGRVAFIGRLNTIRAEMGQGFPLTTIYARHQAALGIGYQSFCKLVARYAGDAKLSARHPDTRDGTPRQASPPPAPVAAPAASTPAAGTPAHVRREPVRGFNHDPLERPDDRKRLLDE